MNVLAIDTTSEDGSVAICSNGITVAEVTLHSTEGLAHLIFGAIEKCKNEANLPLKAVDCFAAAAGPGSFTGVRVGLAAAKGLAESMGKAACGVSNLRALSSFGKNGHALRAIVLDARRGQVYAAVYDSEQRLVLPESVLPLSAFLAQIDPATDYEFISPKPVDRAGTPFERLPFIEPPQALAAAVALCAEMDLQDGRAGDPAALDANYVRRSDAELFWRDK